MAAISQLPVITPSQVSERSIVMSLVSVGLWACLSVCRRTYLKNHKSTSKRHRIFRAKSACCQWPWFGRHL